MTMEHPSFKDVFPIENGDFLAASHVGFQGCISYFKNGTFPTCHFLLYWRVVYLHDQSVEMRDRKLGQRFMSAVTSWWFQILFYVHPYPWGFMIQFDGSHICQMG